MSKNYVKAVLDYLPRLTDPTDTAVLVAIAEYTSDETRLAWPSVASLERRTRLDRRTVQRSLRRLESLALMSTTFGGQDDRGRNTASCYRLEFDHRGQPLEAKMPPKRALQRALGAAPTRQGQPDSEPAPVRSAPPTPPAITHTPSPRVKRIPPADTSSRDLSAERDRQLAALRKKITP